MVKVLFGMTLSVLLVGGGAIGGFMAGVQTQKTVSGIPFVGAWVK